MEVLMLNAPFTRRYNRAARWQASPRGNSLWYPVWLAYATGVLESSGHAVKLVDACSENLSLDRLTEMLKDFNPSLVVIDTSTPSIHSDIFVAEHLKKVFSQAHICFVGPHVSAVPDEVLAESRAVDSIARKEYDYTLKELAGRLQDNSSLEGILGLSFRKDGAVIHNQPRPWITDLDELPFLSDVINRHLNVAKYSLDFVLYPYMEMWTGRGCVFRCSYCLWNQTLMGREYRQRSLDNVFKEIDFILTTMPKINEIIFDDDTFTADLKRIRVFCERTLSEQRKFSWVANARADIVDVDLLKLMKQAGCRALVVGFESGSQHILNNIPKGTQIEKMKTFARLCKKVGIQIHGDFMAGLPGETKETIAQTIKLAMEIEPDTFQFSLAVPFPGTDFYQWLKKEGHLKTQDYSQWLNREGKQRCVINYPNLSSEEIARLVRRGYLRYYLRIKFMFGVLLKIIKNRKEFSKFYIAGKRFLKFMFEKE